MKRLAAFCTVFVCCTVASLSCAEEIKIEGGGAAISHILTPMKGPFEKSTGIHLKLQATSPVKGIIALEKGLVDASVAAHSLENMLLSAAREGVKIDPASLKVAELGQSRLMVMVHKSNKVAALTKDQLHGLFTGHLTNWKEVGGTDLPVVVVWGKATPGQNALFTKEVLDGEQIAATSRLVTDYLSIRDTVAAIPGAIGIDPQGFVSAAINTPEIPLITTPVIFITKGEPSPKVRKLLKFYEDDFAVFQR